MAEFECTMCGACCSNLGEDQMVLLLRRDIVRFSRAFGIAERDFVTRYCEINADLTAQAGTAIVQLKALSGRCVFLEGDNKCGVHQFKPFQCRYGPDRFLQNIMSVDYECMKGVSISRDDGLTDYFFSSLLENEYAEWSCDKHGNSD